MVPVTMAYSGFQVRGYEARRSRRLIHWDPGAKPQ